MTIHPIGGGGVTDHTGLSNIGINTHAQIDTHVADTNLHKGKNFFMNPDFNIWQRGTSFINVATTHVADRWRSGKVGAGASNVNIVRSADVPSFAQSGHQSNYSLQINPNTADTVIGAGDMNWIRYIIEGYDYLPFIGNTATLSFWVKSTKTGIFCVSFQNSISDRSYIAEFTVNASATWEKKTITLTFDYTGGTWDFINGIGLKVNICLAAGSTYQGASANTWLATNSLATANQVNAMDNVANYFKISQMQFELGASATDFSMKSYAEDLADCQRYYQKSYDVDTNPGSVTNNGVVFVYAETAYHFRKSNAQYLCKMRGIPTVATYSPVTGTVGKYYDANAAGDVNSSVIYIGDSNCSFKSPFAMVAGNHYTFHYTLHAEY